MADRIGIEELKGQGVVGLVSGGLDSVTFTRWANDHGVQVHCCTADLGQPDEENIDDIEARMREAGASTFTLVDGRQVIAARIGSENVEVDFSNPSMSMLNPNHAYGTAEDCIGYVRRLAEAGADEILFLCQMGTVPQWAQLETIGRIGTHVIPYFREGEGVEFLQQCRAAR